MTQDNTRYAAVYGKWAGNERGNKPDYTKCCEQVSDGWGFKQCERKRGHGAGLAYCKQHDPVFVETKRRKEQDAWNAKLAVERRNRERPAAFKAALEAIANGHNDPRTLAMETLAEWKS